MKSKREEVLVVMAVVSNAVEGARDALEEERMAVMLWYMGAALQNVG